MQALFKVYCELDLKDVAIKSYIDYVRHYLITIKNVSANNDKDKFKNYH